MNLAVGIILPFVVGRQLIILSCDMFGLSVCKEFTPWCVLVKIN